MRPQSGNRLAEISADELVIGALESAFIDMVCNI